MVDQLKSLGGYAWIIVLLVIVGILILFVYLKKKQKRISLDKVEVGPFKVSISDIPVKRISFLSQPVDISGRPAILPDIVLKVYDEKNNPLKDKKITIELDSYSGTDYLKGILVKFSDSEGRVIFTNLKISRSGKYELVAKSDGQFAMSVPFEVSPPGLDTNFSSKPFGSVEYKEALARKLSLSKAEDELKYDEEEI